MPRAAAALFRGLELGLLDRRLANLRDEWERAEAQQKRLQERRDAQRIQADELKRAVADNGGDRLERLAAEIQQKDQERGARQGKAQRYAQLASQADEQPADDEPGFLAQRRRFAELAEQARSQAADVENAERERDFGFRQGMEQRKALLDDIASLKSRRSNIDEQQVRIRAALCQALELDQDEMPFAGELLQVREDEREWEGAAERLLRGFGLSLLVPDRHYKAVAEWVDRNQLRGRLVYFHVRQARPGALPELHRDSLVRKLSVKPDSPFFDWLERELAHRYDVACCATQEQFRREARAITRAGQLKDPSGRHEKDDRRRIDDRSQYVLGWSNTAKIAALEDNARQLELRLGAAAVEIGKLQDQRRALQQRIDALSRLEEFADFRELDWAALAAEIERLRDEYRLLESASDALRQLNAQLGQLQAELAGTEAALQAKAKEVGAVENKHQAAGSCAARRSPCVTPPAPRNWRLPARSWRRSARPRWASASSPWNPATTASRTRAAGCRSASTPRTRR